MDNKSLFIPVLCCLLLSACNLGARSVVIQSSATTNIPYRSQDYCSIVSSIKATVDPTDAALNALIPPVSDEDWIDGSITATITIVEYLDFQ